MHVRLGKAQRITAIDDGGVSIAFRRDPSSQESHRAVLSVEVKRKKHAKENDETTANRHAAQIFAEMLGQVCHPELFETLDNQYQEVTPSVSSNLPCLVGKFVYKLGICDPY